MQQAFNYLKSWAGRAITDLLLTLVFCGFFLLVFTAIAIGEAIIDFFIS